MHSATHLICPAQCNNHVNTLTLLRVRASVTHIFNVNDAMNQPFKSYDYLNDNVNAIAAIFVFKLKLSSKNGKITQNSLIIHHKHSRKVPYIYIGFNKLD